MDCKKSLTLILTIICFLALVGMGVVLFVLYTDIQAHTTTLEDDAQQLQIELNATKQSLALTLNNGTQQLQAELNATKQELNTQKNEAQLFKRKFKTKEKQLKIKEGQLKTETQRLQTVQTELNATKQELNTQKNDAQQLQTELNTSKQDLNTKKNEAQQLQKELDTKKNEAQQLQKELDTKKNEAQQLQRELDATKQELNTKKSAADCETYEFKVSKTKGTFDEVRTECIGLGGDLLHKNFGPAGARYHKEIEALYSQSGLILWIGYTDREKEGTWRFLDGEIYDAQDTNLGGFCKWGPGEPNNHGGNQHCAKIWYAPVLDDDHCGNSHHGMCEIKTSS